MRRGNAYNLSTDLSRISSALSRAMLGSAADDAAIARAKLADAQAAGQTQKNEFLKGRNDAINTLSDPRGILASEALGLLGMQLDANNNLTKILPPGSPLMTVAALPNQTSMSNADMLAQAGALPRAMLGDGTYNPDQFVKGITGLGQGRDERLARSMILDPAATEDALRRAAMILNQNQLVTERGQDIKSGDTQRGQDIKSDDTQRGQDIRSTDTQRGQDIRSTDTQRGQDIRQDSTERGQDIRSTDTQRGQDIRQDSTERGQDIRSTDTQRGQDIRSDDTQRGQDMTQDTTERGQDIRSDDTQRGQDIRSTDTQRGQDIRSTDTQRGQDIKSESGGFTVSPSDDTALRNFIDESDTENVIDGMSNAATIVNQLVNASVSAMGAKKSIPKAKAFITKQLEQGFTEFKVPNTGIMGQFVSKFKVPNYVLNNLRQKMRKELRLDNNANLSQAFSRLTDTQKEYFQGVFNSLGYDDLQFSLITEKL